MPNISYVSKTQIQSQSSLEQLHLERKDLNPVKTQVHANSCTFTIVLAPLRADILGELWLFLPLVFTSKS